MRANKTNTTTHDDAGKLLLRVALAILILFHGMSKLTGGPGFVTGWSECF